MSTQENKRKILIVDDEPDIRDVVRLLLERKGYLVWEASSGDEAIEIMQQEKNMDLILMDIMMPGMSGIKACETIRGFSSVPILFLTAKTKESDKMTAYSHGGDDYLPKPFSSAELLMKVNSLIRRYRIYQNDEKTEEHGGSVLSIDEQKHLVFRHGQAIELTEKEFELFYFLWQHKDEVLDNPTIYERVWGEKFLPSSTNTIMVYILKLRKKLEADSANPKMIRTVWGKGYQFSETE